MASDEIKIPDNDPTGLLSYEFIANHIDDADLDLPALADNIIRVDRSGQFTASAARYLNAINPVGYAEIIKRLVAATIDKDRERNYLQDLLTAVYGADYQAKADVLSATDDNFRRMYKRLYPNPESL